MTIAHAMLQASLDAAAAGCRWRPDSMLYLNQLRAEVRRTLYAAPDAPMLARRAARCAARVLPVRRHVQGVSASAP